MGKKTIVNAPEGKPEVHITREFNLPVDLLFRAYTETQFIEQWMGTKVLKLDHQTHGSFQFETTDPMGNKHRFNGAIHKCETNKRIIRTFEMENSIFPVQLEYLNFEEIEGDRSKILIHIIFESLADRENLLRLPFVQGINLAHNRLQEVVPYHK